MEQNKLWSIALLTMLMIVSCKSEYTAAVEQGLASGVTHDSLILDMRRGMTKKAFYDHCWQLNKQELVHQGSGNQYALYLYTDALANGDSVDIEMLFYGIFDDQNTMRGMDMIYSFPGWSPWSTRFHVDSLVHHLTYAYERDLGGASFLPLELGLDKIKAYIKIDGDRQITIYPKTERQAAVKIEDLHYKLNDEV